MGESVVGCRLSTVVSVTNRLLDKSVHLCTFVDNMTSEPLKFLARTCYFRRFAIVETL